jgi:hypothetical protein
MADARARDRANTITAAPMTQVSNDITVVNEEGELLVLALVLANPGR